MLKGSIGHTPDRPTVTVIIPAWNSAGTIARALDSALSGHLAEVECVVIDDGSVDGTAAVVEARAAADPRVVLVRAPTNEGVSSARNRGLDRARGEWLTFLDADDVLLPGGLDALVRPAKDGSSLAVVGQRVWTDGVATWVTAAYDKPDIRLPGRKSIAANPDLVYYASATGKLFSRSIVDGLVFHGRVLGDQPWTIRALLRAGARITVVGDVVYEWRRDAAAGTSSITASKRGSARLAAEAAQVAVGALAEVAAEAKAQLSEPRQQELVVARYFERVVGSDLAGPMARAVARGDEGADALFEAVLAFLDAAPAGLVDGSPSVIDGLILRPLDFWVGAPAAVRSDYLAFLRRLVNRFPAIQRRMRATAPVGLGLALLAGGESNGRGAAIPTLLFALRWPVAVLRRKRRGGRRAVAAGQAQP